MGQSASPHPDLDVPRRPHGGPAFRWPLGMPAGVEPGMCSGGIPKGPMGLRLPTKSRSLDMESGEGSLIKHPQKTDAGEAASSPASHFRIAAHNFLVAFTEPSPLLFR